MAKQTAQIEASLLQQLNPTELFHSVEWKEILLVFLAIFLVWVGFRLLVAPVIRRRRRIARIRQCPNFPMPELPKEMDKAIKVAGKNRMIAYRVNLYRATCTCPRFRHFRSCFPPNDIRRLCRHLRQEMDTANLIYFFDELSQRIIKDRIRDRCYQRVTLTGTEVGIGFSPPSTFVRVFTRRRMPEDPTYGPFTGPYDKFVLNVQQEMWIYGEPPPGADQIAMAAKDIFGQYAKSKLPEAPSRRESLV